MIIITKIYSVTFPELWYRLSGRQSETHHTRVFRTSDPTAPTPRTAEPHEPLVENLLQLQVGVPRSTSREKAGLLIKQLMSSPFGELTDSKLSLLAHTPASSRQSLRPPRCRCGGQATVCPNFKPAVSGLTPSNGGPSSTESYYDETLISFRRQIQISKKDAMTK